MMFELDGVAAHEEDDWIGSRVQLGEAQIVVNGDVGRCVVTSHDPDRGITDLDTLGTLVATGPMAMTSRCPSASTAP